MKRVDFVCCDRPNAKPFELHIYAALAQEERRMISERTCAGLAAAKERGVVLGNPKLGESNRTAAAARAESLKPILIKLNQLSARQAAEELNRRCLETPAGGKWHAQTVIRVRERLV
jgi:DNA invertase Pin-like site-specific DNA recombinase